MFHKSKKTIPFILVLLILLNSSLVFAAPISEGLPNIDKLYKSGDLSKFMTKYKDNYDLDMVEFSVFKEPLGLVNIVASFFFTCQVGLCHLLIVIFYYSFELDFFALFKEFIETLIGEFKTGIFDELMIIAIVLIGVFYIINILSNRKTQIWIAIIQTVVLIAVSYAFFSSPARIFQGLDGFSKEISRSILAGTYKADNKGTPQTAVTAAANEIWNMFVHRPWQILEFGNEETAKQYEEEILSLSPNSDERKELVKELSEEKGLFTTKWSLKRLGFIVMYFIPLLVQFLGLVFLCILMLGYQALLIVFAIMGVFVFLLSLIPFFGWRVIGNWMGKVLSCGATKVAVTFILALLLSFNSAIFKLSDTYGWLLSLVLQLVIVIMLVYKRQMFLDMFSIIRLAPQGSLRSNRLPKDYNIERKMFENERENYYKILRNKDFVKKDASYAAEDEEKYNKSSENVGARSHGTTSSRFQYSDEDTGHINTSLNIGEKITERGNYNKLVKTAEEILEKQYEILKEDAEEKAGKTGKGIEYPYFVKQVMTRENLGVQRFDDREIAYTIKQIETVKKSGGNVEQLYKRKEAHKTEQNIERPESVVKVYMNGKQYNMNIESGDYREDESEKMISRLTDNFNRMFNTKYDTRFINSLVKQYGQAQVKYIMEKMEAMQMKNGNIKNAGGYLTKSLKNSRMSDIPPMKMRGINGESEGKNE